MNKNRHRVVFNAARGLRVAVAECARALGKASNTAATATPTPFEPTPSPFGLSPSPFGLSLSKPCRGVGESFDKLRTIGVHTPIKLTITTLLTAFLLPAQAQIAADPSAPGKQRPTILTAPNGVPLVNIQTPSPAGVSRNTYRQFDVNGQGAILNNSRTNVPTQLGGWVPGNPWLATGGARVILNEVNSTNPSYLKGPIEVAGQRAEVIIANPAGIQVNGLSFINAVGVTITTGKPVMNEGSLESFRVQGGQVRIEGLGLDARGADFTNILARATQVNAAVWARRSFETVWIKFNAAQPHAWTRPTTWSVWARAWQRSRPRAWLRARVWWPTSSRLHC